MTIPESAVNDFPTNDFDQNMMRNVALLGSTGSIGSQTLEIARQNKESVCIRVLTAACNVDMLVKQAREFKPECVAIARPEYESALRQALDSENIKILVGQSGLIEAARWPSVDTVVSAVVGSAGVFPTIAAIEAGSRIALANKETLVVAGEIIMPLARSLGVEIIPVDSEHSAIFQCLEGESASNIHHLVLTASGGPFRGRDPKTFSQITRKEALAHPNWDMGPKISVDSATLMNKGLEVIEARWLFDLPADKIRVVVHPQSIIHSMVSFCDGSIKAQMGMPDMKHPIQYALSYPDRWSTMYSSVDWAALQPLAFEAPDMTAFPCLALAYEALRVGGHAPAVLNASNEAAVALFLEEKISFSAIPQVIEKVLANLDDTEAVTLESLMESDSRARRRVAELAQVGSH